MEEKDEILIAIKNRTTIPRKSLSITKCLEACGMMQYRDVCLNRVSEFLDCEHITVDYFDGLDIRCDEVGYKKIEHILKGYIPCERLDNTMEYVRCWNDLVVSQNDTIRFIRSCSTKNIKSFIKNYHSFCDASENFYQMIPRLKAELKARSIPGRIIAKSKELFGKISFVFTHADILLAYCRIFIRNRKQKIAPRGL